MRARVGLLAVVLAGCGAAPAAVGPTTSPATRAPAATPGALPSSTAVAGVDETPKASVSDQRRAAQVARSFIRAYLAFTYRREAEPLRRAPASPELVEALIAAPPDVPADVRRRTPRIAGVRRSWQGPVRASALVTVDDVVARYPVAVQLERVGGGFLVTGIEP